MWKRLNRPMPRQIGNPTLIDSSLDEESQAKLTDLYTTSALNNNGPNAHNDHALSGDQSDKKSHSGNGNVLRYDETRSKLFLAPCIISGPHLTSLPNSHRLKADHFAFPPFSKRTSSRLQTSHARPASSIYSQPSPEMRQDHPKLEIPRASSVYPDDVSPPDSPRTIDGARSSSPNISPITDSGSGFRGHTSHNRPFISNIPLPAQQSSGGTSAYISSWREKLGGQALGREMKTKWDAYSGEPNAQGRPASVIPGETKFDQYGHGTTTTITAAQPKQNIFSTTLRKVSKKDPAATAPPVREEWKGASGRSVIVPPVVEKPNPGGKSKAFPTPSQRRQKQGGLRQVTGLRTDGVHSSGQDSNGRNSPASPVIGRRSSPAHNRNEGPTPPRKNSRPAPDSTLRTIPPRSDSRSPQVIVSNHGNSQTLVESPSHFQDSSSPLTVITNESMPQPPQRRPVADVPPRISSMAISNDFSHMNLHNEPASRFSATTYNTTAPDSSPPSPRQSSEVPPPVPSHAPSTIPDRQPSPSVLNRKRPIPTAGTIAPPARKPTPSQLGNHSDRDSKSLPCQPADAEHVDRVTLLEAKLASLNRRKDNLQTVIHELTHVVQPSSVAYDLASRQEIKKTVEGLNTESAAVAKEIHETGLKLHRALKKRDENAMFEPTGLWVRRVTE